MNKIYTPLSFAKKEIQRRWKDKKLRKKVEDFLENVEFENKNGSIELFFNTII